MLSKTVETLIRENKGRDGQRASTEIIPTFTSFYTTTFIKKQGELYEISFVVDTINNYLSH